MNILITGGGGLIGSRIVEMTNEDNRLKVLAPDSRELNISSQSYLAGYLDKMRPDFIIHSAAMTDVNKAETERDDKKGMAWQLNVEGSRYVAEEASKKNIFLVLISTDMVFSGSVNDKGPYEENKQPETDPSKLSWYGYTKAEAERVVRSTIDKDKLAIVRLSNPVRRKYERKPDYLKKILSAYDGGKPLSLFADQYLTLTYIDEVGQVIKKIIDNRYTGNFHVSSSDLFTPYDLGNYLIEKARGVKGTVSKGSLEDYIKKSGSAARYPQFGGLKVEKTENKLGIKFNSWRETISEIIK